MALQRAFRSFPVGCARGPTVRAEVKMTPERLFTIRELAEHIGQSETFVRRAKDSGLLPYHQQSARGTIYISLSGWQQYLDATRVESPKVSISSRARVTAPRRRSRRAGSAAPINLKDPTAYRDLHIS